MWCVCEESLESVSSESKRFNKGSVHIMRESVKKEVMLLTECVKVRCVEVGMGSMRIVVVIVQYVI
jgi:hypothetical protein